MANSDRNRPGITATKAAFLFLLFFLIAGGLGYPILNRYDPRQTPGLSDVKIYAEMVTGSASTEAGHVRFRVLVPWIAKAVYRIDAKLDAGRSATWNPVMFSLLVADSIFVAATAVLMVLLGVSHLGSSAVGLVAALLYFVNFAVPNLRLAGLVDAGEGFFMLALFWSLAECRFWPLPVIAILGTLAKESFIPLSITFSAAWWLAARRDVSSALHVPLKIRLQRRSKKIAIWIAISWGASVVTFLGLHRAIGGSVVNPVEFALSLHHTGDYVRHIAASLADRQLWYIFLWLLPLAIPNLKQISRPWVAATAATCAVAFALDAFYGGAPGTVGRALFTVAGPLLSLSSAMLLVDLVSQLADVS